VQVASRERTSRRHEVVEALSGNETRYQVRSLSIDVRVEDLDQVRAADAAQRRELVSEPAARRRVGDPSRRTLIATARSSGLTPR
jgi:hypothetical protein